MTGVLLGSGMLLTAIGTWRGYAAARTALGGFLHQGDATRTAVEAARPALERSRVRRSAAAVARAVGWLLLAMYGLFLASVGSGGAA